MKSVVLFLHSLHFQAVIVVLNIIPRAVDSTTAAWSERSEQEALDLNLQQMKPVVR